MSSAKNGYYCHSQHRGLASLRRRSPYPIAEISATLAKAKGILEKDWIIVSTRLGQTRFMARIVPTLANGVIVAEYGWWQACPELGQPGYTAEDKISSNFNKLISAEDSDPISGSVALRSFLCNIERDPRMEDRQRGWTGFRPFRVVDLIEEARGVLGIHFEDIHGALLPDYLPGQHLMIQVRQDNSGILLTRAYSLTGAAEVPSRRGYSIAVRHQQGRTPQGDPIEGRMSSLLHRSLKIGDVVDLSSPSGSFVLPRFSMQPLVMIAGGIGITPFISLLESIAEIKDAPEVWLYYANQNSETHAFRKRIGEIAALLPNLRVANHYNMPLPGDKIGIDFDCTALVGAEIIEPSLIGRRARFYMCGPEPMMNSVRNGLIKFGVPQFDIFSEVFRSPSEVPAGSLKSCKVTFSRSAKAAIEWTSERGTLLQLGESNGISMSSGCRVGQCESCAVRIVSGRIMHLSGSDPEDPSICLACQAVPIGDVVLDA